MGTLARMSDTPKKYGDIDVALSMVIADLLEKSGESLRVVAARAGMSHNRLGKIKRQETPPASPGELDRIAIALGTTASEVFAAAERSDYMLAAREADDDGEAEAGQIDP